MSDVLCATICLKKKGFGAFGSEIEWKSYFDTNAHLKEDIWIREGFKLSLSQKQDVTRVAQMLQQ